MSVFVAPRRRGPYFALVACLVAALGGLVGVTSATAGSPNLPTQMTITSISSFSVPGGVPDVSKPNTVVAAGGTVDLTVELRDSSGNLVGFPNDTTVSITSTGGSSSPSKATVPAGLDTVSIPVTFASAANNVGVTLTVTRGPAKGLTTGPLPDALRFDVLTELKTASSDTVSFGIGGDDGQCTNATRSNPVCGIVLLPSGAESDVLLSTGLCDAAYQCDRKGALIQTLFAGGNLYGPDNPAALVIKCDKSLCGTGQIQNVPVNFTFAGNGALTSTATACPAKGTVGDLEACVDYVQSKRDGSGDTILYLLFAHDMRGSVG